MTTYEKAKDPNFWAQVRSKACYQFYRKEAMRYWEEYCAEPPKPLSEEEYALFYETGNREIYEKSFFLHRQALTGSAVMALLYPEEEKYLSYLASAVEAICDETTWCLPAHQKIRAESRADYIDLFASETGFYMAEIYVLLGDRLGTDLQERIKQEVSWRILDSYEKYSYQWERTKTNWAAVCTGSVAGCCYLMRPDLFEAWIPRFESGMASYLSGIPEDGFCLEGPGYWEYGFGFFTFYADLLRSYTDGGIDHFQTEKVRKLASFYQKNYLSGKALLTFSDVDFSLSCTLGMLHYLKKEYPDAVQVYSTEEASYTCDMDEGKLAAFLRSALWLEEEYVNRPDVLGTFGTVFAETAQWLIHKTPQYGFAAKGGCNKEPHNHNDVGSFIVAREANYILADPGRGEYTAAYFPNETRYTHFHPSSFSHSVPIIDGCGQKFGEQYRAERVSFDGSTFSLEMQEAYGNEKLKKLRRSFALKENGVQMRDEITGDCIVTERLVALEKPTLEPGVIWLQGCKLCYLPADCQVALTVIDPLGSDPLTLAADRSIEAYYLMDLMLPAGTEVFELDIQMPDCMK